MEKAHHITGVRQQRAKSTVPVSPLSPSTKTLVAITADELNTKMTIKYKDYFIDIVDDQTYSINSADNTSHYDKIYFDDSMNQDRFYPTSKHGIRVRLDNNEQSSALVCEVGGATTIHENSFIISDDRLYICCCDKVYSLKIPDLSIDWSKRLDPATCFGIYTFDNDLIIHGELTITRIDKGGNLKWEFGARDIFVTQDNTKAIVLNDNNIELKDWESNKYTLDKNGIEIK